MRISILLIVFLSLNGVKLNAQVQQSAWSASFNTIKLNSNFSVHFDAQVRSTDNVKNIQTILLRPGINYHANDKLMLSAGYAYIPNRRSVNNFTGYLSEHRIWEQMIYAHKLSSVSVAHRLRLEQRFIPVANIHNNELEANEHLKAHRLRYFIRNIIPAKKQPFTKGLFFALQNEVFLNVANQDVVNNKFFDQNRLYTAVGYRMANKIDIEVGYMHQYVQQKVGTITNHIGQIAVYKRL